MKTPDASKIKKEIEEISGRIDNILKTVKKYYPLTETESAGQSSPEEQSKQDESTSRLNQEPDQEV